MAESDALYRASSRRIELLTLGLGAAAALVAAVRGSWRVAAGLVLGAALGWVNYRWLKQGVDTLARLSTAQADSPQARVPKRVHVKFFGRFALLVGVAYVILSRSLVPAAAFLAGLFALVAAVMVELVVQLVRGERP